MWADRTAALAAMPGIVQVFPFENCGVEIGVTLSHPHGQIYAYPFVTPKTARMLRSARRYRNDTGRNLFADVLAADGGFDLVFDADGFSRVDGFWDGIWTTIGVLPPGQAAKVWTISGRKWIDSSSSSVSVDSPAASRP